MAAERDYQRELLKDSRSAELQERWRDERRNQYLTFISKVQSLHAWAWARHANTLQPGISVEYDEVDVQELKYFLSTVRIFASDPVRDSALRLVDGLEDLRSSVHCLVAGADGRALAVKTTIEANASLLEELFDLMRTDLGLRA